MKLTLIDFSKEKKNKKKTPDSMKMVLKQWKILGNYVELFQTAGFKCTQSTQSLCVNNLNGRSTEDRISALDLCLIYKWNAFNLNRKLNAKNPSHGIYLYLLMLYWSIPNDIGKLNLNRSCLTVRERRNFEWLLKKGVIKWYFIQVREERNWHIWWVIPLKRK